MGWLSYTDSERRVDCMKYSCTGIPVPVQAHHVREINSLAEYVLLVEKETVFQRLADDGFCLRNRCIIITGKGYPDVATRRWFYSIFQNTSKEMIIYLTFIVISFVRLLTDTLRIPVFGLVDCDPHGVEILLTYRFGSLTMAYDAAALATEEIYWLGVFLSDCDTFGLEPNCLLPLSDQDKGKAIAILNRSYVTQFASCWRTHVERMLDQGVKFEIEAMATISLSFLTDVYLPTKIRAKYSSEVESFMQHRSSVKQWSIHDEIRKSRSV